MGDVGSEAAGGEVGGDVHQEVSAQLRLRQPPAVGDRNNMRENR